MDMRGWVAVGSRGYNCGMYWRRTIVIAGEKAVGKVNSMDARAWRGGSYGLCVRVCTGWRCRAVSR